MNIGDLFSNCGAPGQPPCDESYFKKIRDSRQGLVNENSDGTVSTHRMTHQPNPNGDGSFISFPTLFLNEDKSWKNLDPREYIEEGDYKGERGWGQAYDRAVKDNEIYTFKTEEEAKKFAVDGSWKNNKYSTGGVVDNNSIMDINSLFNDPTDPPVETELTPEQIERQEMLQNIPRESFNLIRNYKADKANPELRKRFKKVNDISGNSCLGGALNCGTQSAEHPEFGFMAENLPGVPSLRSIMESGDQSKYKTNDVKPKDIGNWVKNSSVDAWEVHNYLRGEKLGYNPFEDVKEWTYNKNSRVPDQILDNLKRLPIGTIIGQGDVNVKTTGNDGIGYVGYAKQNPKNKNRNRHGFVIMGYDEKDGMPITYDSGKEQRLDNPTWGGGVGKVNNVTIPNEYKNLTYQNLLDAKRLDETRLGYSPDNPDENYTSLKSTWKPIKAIEKGFNEHAKGISEMYNLPKTTMDKFAALLPGLSNSETKLNNNNGQSADNYFPTSAGDSVIGNIILKPGFKSITNALKSVANTAEDIYDWVSPTEGETKEVQDWQLEIQAHKKYPNDTEKEDAYYKELAAKRKTRFSTPDSGFGDGDSKSSVGAFKIKDLSKYANKIGLKKSQLYGHDSSNSEELERGSVAAVSLLAEKFNEAKKKWNEEGGKNLSEDQLIKLAIIGYSNNKKMNSEEFVDNYITGDLQDRDTKYNKIANYDYNGEKAKAKAREQQNLQGVLNEKNSNTAPKMAMGGTVQNDNNMKREKFMFGGNTGMNDFLGDLLTKRQNQANADPTRIENPNTALADNNIALAKAQSEAQSNPWTQGLDMFGNMAMQVGTSMMQQGMANGEGISKGKDGVAGSGDKGEGFNWGSLLGAGTQALGAYGNQQTNSFAMGGQVNEMLSGMMPMVDPPTEEEKRIAAAKAQGAATGSFGTSNQRVIKGIAESLDTQDLSEEQIRLYEKHNTEGNKNPYIKFINDEVGYGYDIPQSLLRRGEQLRSMKGKWAPHKWNPLKAEYDRDMKILQKQRGAQALRADGMLNMQNHEQQMESLNTFAMGGMTGGNSQMIEAEGGEVVETPDGAMQELQGPDHEQGGINLNLPEGTEIFSKRLKGPDGRTMADRKISREKKLTKAEKLYKKNPSDATLKKTVERITAANEREEGLDMAEMEQARQTYQMGAMMLTGGKMRYATGGVTGTVPGATKNFRTSLEQLQDHYSVYMNQYPESNIDFTTEQGRKNFQKDMGLTPDGVFGRDTQRLVDQHLSEGAHSYMTDLDISLGNPTSIKPLTFDIPTGESLEDYQTRKMAKTKAYEDGTLDSSYLTRDEDLSGKVEWDESRVGGAVNSAVDYIGNLFNKSGDGSKGGDPKKGGKGMNFTLGDGLGIAGNYMAMTDPMKNTLANRAGDRANINYFEDYGKEGLETLENSKRFAMNQRDQAMQDLELSKTAARNRSRGMSRGLNAMRAGDLSAELGAMQAEGKINSSYMAQLLGIDGQIASAQNQQDQMVMQGEGTKDMNDRRDYDNFYSQLGIDKATRAEGMMNMGSISNKIKERGVKGEALNQLYENYKVNGMSGDVAYKAAEMTTKDPTFFNSLDGNPNKNAIFEGLQAGTMTKVGEGEGGKLYNAEGQELDIKTLKPII